VTGRVVQIGNFRPPHSTENELRAALGNIGIEMKTIQEDDWAAGRIDLPDPKGFDFLLWTRTWPVSEARAAQSLGPWKGHTPIVGYHLDRWWGLDRQSEIKTHPFFRWPDLLCTADGGHQDEWRAADITHFWFPPAVSAEATRATGALRPEYAHDVVFAGQWKVYHPEWLPYRRALVEFLQRRYGNRFTTYPRPGEHAVRGQDLMDLYASAKVLVGDSCLAGTGPVLPQGVRGGAIRYWSDRLPETLGRGGLLIHPWLNFEGHFQAEEHLLTYELGNFDELGRRIDWALANPEDAALIRKTGRDWVAEHHTYEVRMRRLVNLVGRLG